MSKPFQPQAVGLVSLLSLSLLLAACGGAAQPASPESSTPAQGQETAAGVAESSPTAEVTEAAAAEEPTAIAAATSEAAAAPAASSGAPAACQPVDIPSNTLIAPVSDQEWSKGLASAPVTLIEYGDFQ